MGLTFSGYGRSRAGMEPDRGCGRIRPGRVVGGVPPALGVGGVRAVLGVGRALVFALLLAALLLASAATLPPPLSAQEGAWVTRSALMEVDLGGDDGGADVTIRYELTAGAGGALPVTRPIDFELLGFGAADAARFTTSVGTTVELWPTHGSHRAAAIHPPFDRDGDVVVLELQYRIDRAVQEDRGALLVRVPVLSGPVPTTGPGAEGFEARLLLPPGWTVSEAFPSGLNRAGDDGVSVRLPVTPSMVGFRGRSDGRSGPGVPIVVDLVTLAILFGFSLFGWRHLRGLARRETGA